MEVVLFFDNVPMGGSLEIIKPIFIFDILYYLISLMENMASFDT